MAGLYLKNKLSNYRIRWYIAVYVLKKKSFYYRERESLERDKTLIYYDIDLDDLISRLKMTGFCLVLVLLFSHLEGLIIKQCP